MIAIPLVAALLLGTPQQSGLSQSEIVRQQRIEQAKAAHEPARQTASHINHLAGNIYSEADARDYVDAVAEELTHHRRLSWTTRSIRHRVAHAEFEAATDPSRQIPEQRIVDVWNEYVREIDAPGEAVITVAELHNLRDAMYSSASDHMWKYEMTQSLWTMPSIYEIDADGKVASGCRAVEALKIIRDMHEMFAIVRGARARVQKGFVASDLNRQRQESLALLPKPIFSPTELHAMSTGNPIHSAAYRYQQEHGERAYQQLLKRLFAELFPAD
jgi:hypothetical protein